MNQNEIKYLFNQYVTGKASEEEKMLLESWYLQWYAGKPLEFSKEEADKYLAAIEKKNPFLVRRQRNFRWKHIAAIFLALSVLSSVAYYYVHISDKSAKSEKNDTGLALIRPGSVKAVLTLSNGRKINLDETQKGLIAKESGGDVVKTDDGEIKYNQNENVHADKGIVTFNTISTPKGGEYTVRLPDGTVVILNAATSLRYPTVFEGKERIVELRGEAYFKVRHNSLQPFKVKTQNQLIEDIGTEFNVNSYDDGITKTTLVEGSVSVSDTSNYPIVLKQGQQALSSKNGQLTLIKHPDVEQVTAWKNGYFKFDGEPIRVVMAEISRWYAVKINYEDGLTKEGFYGTISRNRGIEDVLKMLELTGLIHFKLSGNEIIVQQ